MRWVRCAMRVASTKLKHRLLAVVDSNEWAVDIFKPSVSYGLLAGGSV